MVVNGRTNGDAAWYYAHPSAAASVIADHVAFWHGVHIEASDGESAGGWLNSVRRLIRR